MRIGGLQKLSLIDYPGHLAAVIFTCGCNFRCPYCHNPALVVPGRYTKAIPVEEVLGFLRQRVNVLEAVVVSGGEPTVHPDLPDFLKEIRSLSFRVKLDTNGSRPEMLRKILQRQLVDYIAMDVKAGIRNYAHMTRTQLPVARIMRSIETIKNSGIAHEFRTTVVKSLYAESDLSEIHRLVQGCHRYRLQFARLSETILDPDIRTAEEFSKDEQSDLCRRWEINTANP